MGNKSSFSQGLVCGFVVGCGIAAIISLGVYSYFFNSYKAVADEVIEQQYELIELHKQKFINSLPFFSFSGLLFSAKFLFT